jgi:hypothetical protein
MIRLRVSVGVRVTVTSRVRVERGLFQPLENRG